MKFITALVTSIVLLRITCANAADEYNPNPNKWEVIPRPDRADWDRYHTFLYAANYSAHEWIVNISNDSVVARLAEDVKAEKKPKPNFDTTAQLQDSKAPADQFLKVSDGWIVSYNQGEFGSAVYWFSDDGLTRKKLSEHQINEFLIEGDRIFAVEGLAHLSVSRGSMIEIRKTPEAWEAVEFLPLPAAAEAIARVGMGDYVIVTSDMLVRVNLRKEIRILVPTGEWGGLYPNSVAVDDKYIYIGMRQFVARCRIDTSVQKFDLLAPTREWLNIKIK